MAGSAIQAGLDGVRHEARLVSSDVASRRPAAALRGRARSYTGYDERATGRRTLRELPSGDVVLVISFGPALAIIEPGAETAVLRSSFVAGIHASYAITDVPSFQHGLEIRLTPVGAYTLLGLPMNTLANRAVPLDDVLGNSASELGERLYALSTWGERFDLVDAFLADSLERGRAPSPSAVFAWQRLEATHGRLPISTLAAELGATRKHIVERFRIEIGVPPKTLGRVLRFRRAVALLGGGQLTLAEIARHCGYSDQSHFNRDFRELAGLTPGSFQAGLSVAAD